MLAASRNSASSTQSQNLYSEIQPFGATWEIENVLLAYNTATNKRLEPPLPPQNETLMSVLRSGDEKNKLDDSLYY